MKLSEGETFKSEEIAFEGSCVRAALDIQGKAKVLIFVTASGKEIPCRGVNSKPGAYECAFNLLRLMQGTYRVEVTCISGAVDSELQVSIETKVRKAA